MIKMTQWREFQVGGGNIFKLVDRLMFLQISLNHSKIGKKMLRNPIISMQHCLWVNLISLESSAWGFPHG